MGVYYLIIAIFGLGTIIMLRELYFIIQNMKGKDDETDKQ